MEVKTKFNLKDEVYPITHGMKEVITECSICHGKGEIEVGGNTYRCPECYGTGEHRECKDAEWYVATNLIGKIGKVDIELYSNKKYGESKTSYMLSSTGIGSGTLWNENDLFLTFDEAQQECDKRNSKVE